MVYSLLDFYLKIKITENYAAAILLFFEQFLHADLWYQFTHQRRKRASVRCFTVFNSISARETIMALGIFPELDEDAIYLSRTNPDEILGTYSSYNFILEDKEWPTVEHYYQAMKFLDENYQEKIRNAKDAKKARSLGRTRMKKIRKDWSKIKDIIMTRGVYIKCRSHEPVAKALLDTEEKKLVDSTQYDYYWGVGRDRRGKNAYGKVLMNVRRKLRE